jgi:hypothetical protein
VDVRRVQEADRRPRFGHQADRRRLVSRRVVMVGSSQSSRHPTPGPASARSHPLHPTGSRLRRGRGAVHAESAGTISQDSLRKLHET